MFDETVRARFARVATPLGLRVAAWGVTPVHVTWAAFGLALAAAVAVSLDRPVLGLAVWLTSRAADGLDGVLARVSQQQTPFGGYLDITLDMASYSAMLLGFAVAHPEQAVMWQAILAGYVLAITTSLALAAAAERTRVTVSDTNRSIQFTSGLAEAGETSVVYACWALLPSTIAAVGWAWVALLVATAVQRTWFGWRHLPRTNS